MKRTLGVCYYPEHWPESKWAEDAARMAALGLTWVRIGEFAWSRMEPEPGRFDWEWLDRAIAVLGGAGLKVVLGTPTATPPRWMLEKHPDMLAVDAEGRPRGFGSRRHYCFSHRGYRQESARIVTELARRYGRNPHVAAWQTDNEYGCHDTVLSYSDASRDAFREWLAQRYQSPQALNRAWGNVFWSMEYSSFDEIGLPNLTVTEANPSHVMAFRRFASDEVVAFNRVQTEIIRKFSDAPIAHNYMGRTGNSTISRSGGFWDMRRGLPTLGLLSDRLEASAEHKRASCGGDPDFSAFHHDLYRRGAGAGGGHGNAAGPVNWAPWNADPLPGMARLWAWEAFAHGAEAVCYFRWRQAPFAQEQMHAGLLRPDSAPAQAFEEAGKVAQELAAMPDVGTARADVALVFDYASAWAWATQPQGRDFDYFRLAFAFYRGLRRLGLNVDILPPDVADLSAYKLVLAPGVATLSEAFLGALKAHQGAALIGPRSNAKTVEFATPVPLPPNLPGLEAVVARVESLPPDVPVPLEGGGNLLHWREKIETGAEVVERAADGWPALIRAGGLHYLGGWPEEAVLDRMLLRLCEAQGIEVEVLPEGLRRRDTDTHRFWFNYNPFEVDWDGVTLPAAGVHWEAL